MWKKFIKWLALVAAALACLVWAVLPERQMDEGGLRRMMDGSPAAVYDFMGGTCCVYESGELYLGAIFWPRERAVHAGRVQYGAREIPAEEYYELYGDAEYMPYSQEDKAYVGEMGDLWYTRTVPTHEFPMQCLPMEEGVAFVWTMSRADFDALDAHRAVDMKFDDGGEWSAALERRN